MSQPKRWLITLAIALSLVLAPTTSWAKFRWSYGNQQGWGIDEAEVCQDSVKITLLNRSSNIPPGDPGYGVEPDYNMTARIALYTAAIEAPNEDDTSQNIHKLEKYGPLLNNGYTFTATWHTEPFTAAIEFDPPTAYYQYEFATVPYTFTIDATTPISIVVEGRFGEQNLKALPVNPCLPITPIVMNFVQIGPGSTATVVTDALVFQVTAKFGANNRDGLGVERVLMRILGANGLVVHEREVLAPAYCAFGGTPCNGWNFADNNNQWPSGAPITYGPHTLAVEVQSSDDRVFTSTQAITLVAPTALPEVEQPQQGGVMFLPILQSE